MTMLRVLLALVLDDDHFAAAGPLLARPRPDGLAFLDVLEADDAGPSARIGRPVRVPGRSDWRAGRDRFCPVLDQDDAAPYGTL
jgi:hypothetical protein